LTVITDPLFYLLAIPAVTFLGLSKGGFAGLGMLATPLLALIVPPLEAAAILLPILIVQDAISVWTYHRAWSAWNLKVLLPGSVFGVAGGWLFARFFSNAAIELTVGTIALTFVLYVWLGARLRAYLGRPPVEPQRPHAAMGVFWGAMSGFTSTLIQVGGPPFHIHILPQRLEKLTLVGTTVIFFTIVNWMKRSFLISRSASSRPATWPRRRCCCRLQSPPTFSASGWCGSRRPIASTESPTS
jgi:uncharacterized membrane protein YfcA